MPKSKTVPITSSKPPYLRTTKNSNKEFENIQCPICMEHPHCAVLLVCSSHDQGCRPYMCNAPIQSPCLAQYRATSATGQLSCPLCRGHVTKESVVEEGRWFMDSKVRGCKQDGCVFNGNRKELMWHWWECHAEEELRRKRARFEHDWELQAIVTFTGRRIVPLHDTSADLPSATPIAGVRNQPLPPRIRRAAMSVRGNPVWRGHTSPILPDDCLYYEV